MPEQIVKKKIALVTNQKKTWEMLASQLQELIGDWAEIYGFSLEEPVKEKINVDLLLYPNNWVLERFKHVISPECQIVEMKRTLNPEGLEKLFEIPQGKKAYVASGPVVESTKDTIDIINELEINQLNLIPLTEDSKYYDELVITPGWEILYTQYKNVMDIGLRPLDISTVMMVMTKLGLPYENANLVSAKFLRKIVGLTERLNIKVQQQREQLAHLNDMMDSVSSGIILVNMEGNILSYNKTAVNLLEIIPTTQEVRDLIGNESETENESVDSHDVPVNIVNRNGRMIAVYLSSLTAKEKNEPAAIILLRDIQNLENLEMETRKRKYKPGFFARYKIEDIITSSPPFIKLIEQVKRIANTDLTVLIEGESGVGKEMLAQAIHNLSPRKNKFFVPVNLGALPANLTESELFGYVKGAFTGADPRGKKGLFEIANGGTIFLDEIGEGSPSVQTALLRVLQEHEVIPIGHNSSIPVNVRVIAATNRELELLVEKGIFRKDLFFRLNVVNLYVPPLRERREDISYLIKYFCEKYIGSNSFHIDPEVMDILLNYHWPGNVRELENMVQYWVATMALPNIQTSDIPSYIIRSINKAKVTLRTEKDKETREILHVIMERTKEGKKSGRRSIAAEMNKMGWVLSEDQIRLRLSRLKKSGLIDNGVTSKGTVITKTGIQLLEEQFYY